MKKASCLLLSFFFLLISILFLSACSKKEKTPVVIDTDPGIDDAFALMAMAASDQVDIRGITTVHGNVSLAKTSLNALKLACYLGIDCPVAVGAECALDGSTSDAIYVHGANGLGNVLLPEPTRGFDERTATELLHDAAVECKGKLQILAIGPLTNIAAWMTEYPEDIDLIAGITLMGGSQSGGNTSTYGEFNSYADPKAAGIVYDSGVSITMVDYSITRYNYIFVEDLLDMVYPQNLLYPFITSLCDFLENDSAESGGITLHDVQAALLLIRPNAYFTRQANVTVAPDLRGDHRGETLVELNEKGNVRVIKKGNSSRIRNYVADVISYFDEVEIGQQTAVNAAITQEESGWIRLIASSQPVIRTESDREIRLELLYELETTGSVGAILKVKETYGSRETPPELVLQSAGTQISFSPCFFDEYQYHESVYVYLSEEPLPADFDWFEDPFTLSADGREFSSITMEKTSIVYKDNNGQLFLPLNPLSHHFCVITPHPDAHIAAPVITGEDNRSHTAYSIAIKNAEINDQWSVDLLYTPTMPEDVRTTGLEYEGLYEEIESDVFIDWNAADIPAELSIQDFTLQITESRTKKDGGGTPCIRVVYDPFTSHGRVWKASSVRWTPDGPLTAVPENGFLFFPLREGEEDTVDHPLDFSVTLSFLRFQPKIIVFPHV